MTSKRMADLYRDFESFLKGGEPSGVELARAPVLDIWSTDVVEHLGKSVVVLKGVVHRHPIKGDGDRVVTSPAVWLDRGKRWARTTTRLYVLDGAEILVEGLPL